MSVLRHSFLPRLVRRNSRSLVGLGSTLILVAAVAACGSSKSILAPANFAKQANAICADTRAKMDAVTPPTDLASAATQFAKLATISQAGTDDLAALSVAGDSKVTRDAMVDALDKANILLKAASKAALAGNEDAVNKASDGFNTHIEEVRAVATDAGLDDCAAGGDSATSNSDPVTSDPSATDPSTTDPVSAGGIPQYIDAATVLNGWPGQTISPLSEADAADFAASSATGPNDPIQVVAVGALNVTDDVSGELSFVTLFELDRELSADERDQFIAGVVGDASDVTAATIAGVDGVTYTGPGGEATFLRLTGSTAILVFAASAESLQATVTGLFSANPDL